MYTSRAGSGAADMYKEQQKGWAISRREDVADNSDDVVCDRRRKHRHAGLAGTYRSRDVAQMQILISVFELSPDEAPTPPDPDDRSIGKRQWELSTAKNSSIMEGLQVHIYYMVSDICMQRTYYISLHLSRGMQAWRSAV